MHKIVLYTLSLLLLSGAAFAQEQPSPPSSSGWLKSITLEGAPIASQHFQSGHANFNESHDLAIAKISTNGYGNWGVYLLTPNSVDDTSVGVGYVTNPYTFEMGSTRLELTGGLGLVTGYQDYPLPFLFGEARWSVYRQGPWDAGLAMGVMPYVMEDEETGDNEFGVVGTTPFLSVRYNFQ